MEYFSVFFSVWFPKYVLIDRAMPIVGKLLDDNLRLFVTPMEERQQCQHQIQALVLVLRKIFKVFFLTPGK